MLTGERQDRSHKIAYFVTPHGFGHAARAAAVMSHLYDRLPQVHFHIYTTVPQWFFSSSIKAPFSYHDQLTDIGLVQATPLKEDFAETLKRLDDYYPLNSERIDGLTRNLQKEACSLAICDIAPLGIAAAAAAGIPSVLIENFTWDWIYAHYVNRFPGFRPHIAYLRQLFKAADHRIQAQPVCNAIPGSETTLPISRGAKIPRKEIRRQLGIARDRPVVLVTMGGVPEYLDFDTQLNSHEDVTFILPGSSIREYRHGNVIRLPQRSLYYHPDLIQCADAVVSKAGYSTLAEVYQAGTPFGYILRPAFRESAVLESYIEACMPSVVLDPEDYHTGAWLTQVERLLSLSPKPRHSINGAEQAAALIMQILQNGTS